MAPKRKRREPRNAYLIKLEDVPVAALIPKRLLKGGSVGAQIVYGEDSSLMIATREPGYHSTPHRHAAEQMNYVLAGELFIFIANDGFLARKGDFFRIPRNAIHWSWVTGRTRCTLLEVHTPPLIGKPINAAETVGLFARGEGKSRVRKIPSEWPEFPAVAQTEKRVRARYGVSPK